MSANRSSGRVTPSRPAIATRWMNSLVEPPVADNTRMALSKARGVIVSSAGAGELHRTRTGALGQVAPAGFDRRHYGGARQRHPEDLRGDRHRGGGTHYVADPDGGCEDPFELVPLLVVDAARQPVRPQSPDVRSDDGTSLEIAATARVGGQHDRRFAGTGGTHQLRRYGFVAA